MRSRRAGFPPRFAQNRRASLFEVIAVASLLVSFACPSSRAAIDAQLNTSNFVSGQASELSIDGIVTSGGPSTSITGATLTIAFDPANVSLSGFRAGTGWSLQNTNTDNLTQGWVKAVLTNTSNDGAGQTATDPILYFTVTPATAQVDPDDCGNLRFAGVDSDLADQEYVAVYPSDPCAGQLAPLGREDGLDASATRDSSEGEGERATAPVCTPDVVLARQLLMVAGGLRQPTENDLAWDSDSDGKVSIVDVVAAIQAPCGAPGLIWANSYQDANCGSSPAVANIDGDVGGRIDAAYSTGNVNPNVYNADPLRSGNPQKVHLITDVTAEGDLGSMIGWPCPMRDAPMGLALANIAGNVSSNTDPLEVLATNFQDEYDLGGISDIYSHLYAWTHDGGGINISGGLYEFAFHLDPDNLNGIGIGHVQRSPVVWNLNAQGPPEVFVAYQGQQDPNTLIFYGGGMTVHDTAIPHTIPPPSDPPVPPVLNTIVQTQSANLNGVWYTYPGNESLFDCGPTFPRTSTGARHVALVSVPGLAYRWDTAGNAVPGWHPSATAITETDKFEGVNGLAEDASIETPLVTADLAEGAGDETLVASGLVQHYWGFFGYSPETADGAVYCWRQNGTLMWRYPAFIPGANTQDFGPAITSGLALGRLKGGNSLCVVFGDAAGNVTALSNTGSVLWTFSTRPPHHIAYRPIWAQPLIADLTGDGKQDVIVGTANGYVYAINGDTGDELWHTVTSAAPDTDYLGVVESHYKEVKGLALGPLNAWDTSKAVILVTAGLPNLTTPAPQQGYVVALEGSSGTFNSSAADWPQFQGNELRTGTYPRP